MSPAGSAGRTFDEVVAPYFAEVLAAIRSELFDTIGHLDYVKKYVVNQVPPSAFASRPDVYEPLLRALVEAGMALEVNASGLRQGPGETYPAPPVVERYRALGGRRVTAGSDAHRARSFAYGLGHAYAAIAAAGFEALAVPPASGRSAGGFKRAAPGSGTRERGLKRDPRRHGGSGPGSLRDMELLVVGSGAAYPGRPGTASSCYVVTHEEAAICLDIGQGAFAGLAGRLEPEDLAAVIISHLHPDHFVDLVALRHYLRYEFDPPRRVRVIAPRGLAERLDGVTGETDFAAWIARDRGSRGGPRPGRAVPHREPSRHPHGRQLRDARHPRGCAPTAPALVYSGDCGRASDLEPLIRPGDVLLCEVAFGPGPVPVPDLHLDGTAVGRLAAASRASQVLLTHLQLNRDPGGHAHGRSGRVCRPGVTSSPTGIGSRSWAEAPTPAGAVAPFRARRESKRRGPLSGPRRSNVSGTTWLAKRYRRRRSGLVFGMKTRRLATRPARARRTSHVPPAGWPVVVPRASVGGGVTCGLLVTASTHRSAPEYPWRPRHCSRASGSGWASGSAWVSAWASVPASAW